MKHVWIQKTSLEEVKEAIELLRGIQNRNLVDFQVLEYPATTLLKATNGERNLMHVPVQTVYMVESLGLSQQNSATENALALRELFQVVQWESHKNGQGEIYFLCRDEETVKFAEHQGMERVVIPLFRMKVR